MTNDKHAHRKMQVYTATGKGVLVDPFDFTEDQVNIRSIAHALSNKCRFGGHCLEFYSVADHSILVSEAVYNDTMRSMADGKTSNVTRVKKACKPALHGLLHDAAEAYMPDFMTGTKGLWLVNPDPRKLNSMYSASTLAYTITSVIFEKFGLVYHEDEIVRFFDDVFLATEKRDLMEDMEWPSEKYLPDPLPTRICPRSPRQAAADFLELFEAYTKGMNR